MNCGNHDGNKFVKTKNVMRYSNLCFPTKRLIS